MFEEACSKLPCLADVEATKLRLAKKFNRSLPKHIEIEIAWRSHNGSTRLLRGQND